VGVLLGAQPLKLSQRLAPLAIGLGGLGYQRLIGTAGALRSPNRIGVVSK
jgi:hypothetical protein